MKIIFIILFTFTTICYSQKHYDFDYIIEYEFTIYKDSIKKDDSSKRIINKQLKKYYLTNSKNNDYLATLIENDSLSFRLIFRDNNGITLDVNILKSDFIKGEFINIDCEYVSYYMNPFKYQIKHYDFHISNDTLINNKLFNLYKLRSIDPKREKRKKLAKEYYIIDKSTDFHLPILEFPTAYEEWKSNKNLPNGIMSEKILFNYSGSIATTQKLVGYKMIDKKIVIPSECDFTTKED